MNFLRIIILIALLTNLGCAKNNPEKSILGRWEVVALDAIRKADSNPQIFEDFKNDASYFKEIIFYEDSLVYFNYEHIQPILGTYWMEENIFDDFDFQIVIEHKNIQDTIYPKKFDFDNSTFLINKLTRNKLRLELITCPCADGVYENFYIELKKTGVFEK